LSHESTTTGFSLAQINITQPNQAALRVAILFGENMSAKVIPFRRHAVRVSKQTSVPTFVQVPFASLMEMLEQEESMASSSEGVDSRSPEEESSDGMFEHFWPAVPVTFD
jgi:hypothetical protein